MKKLFPALFIAVLGLTVTSTSAAAQFLFVGGGPTFPMSDYGDYANTGFLITAGGGFPLGENGLNILVEGGWGQNSHSDVDGDKTNPITVMGGLEYDFNTSGEGPNPYVYGIAGLMWHKYSSDTSGSDSQSAFGYSGGLGVGFPLGGVSGWVEGKLSNAAFDEAGTSYNTMFAAIMAGISIDLGS
jgi:hypothetical protein